MGLGITLCSSTFILANAAPPTPTGATVSDLVNAIDIIEDPTQIWDGGTPDLPVGCAVETVVFARGIQSYKSDGTVWKATGPLAELYDIEFEGDFVSWNTEQIMVHEAAGDKIGTHYQHLSKPAWEFPNGLRVIVESAFKLPAPDPSSDIKWLNVALRDGSVKVDGANNKEKIKNKDVPNRLYRVLTSEGVAPADILPMGTTTGSGYTTFYVFLACP